MAGAALGTVLGYRTAAAVAAAASNVGPSHVQPPPHFPSFQHSSSRNLIPAFLASDVPSCHSPATSSSTLGNCRRSLLPVSLYSPFPISLSRPFFVDSGVTNIVGLAGGLNGEFVQDLRRVAMRRNPTKTGMKVRSMSGKSEAALEELIQSKNSGNAVVVYSKMWCPYCSMVKGLFTKLGVPFEVVELDQLADEMEVQDALRTLTGQSTVPNVFVGGKHIGGCDDTMDLHNRGELVPALEAAGLKVTAA
ncbi:unnamed protein product [Calypogeia fissa]